VAEDKLAGCVMKISHHHLKLKLQCRHRMSLYMFSNHCEELIFQPFYAELHSRIFSKCCIYQEPLKYLQLQDFDLFFYLQNSERLK
jgi:hypothetical protein